MGSHLMGVPIAFPANEGKDPVHVLHLPEAALCGELVAQHLSLAPPVPQLELLAALVIQNVIVKNARLGAVFPTSQEVVASFDVVWRSYGHFGSRSWHDGMPVMTDHFTMQGHLSP